jgi:hypothetical protein
LEGEESEEGGGGQEDYGDEFASVAGGNDGIRD